MVTKMKENPRLLLLDANRSRKELLSTWFQNEGYQTKYFFNTSLFLNALNAEGSLPGHTGERAKERLLLVFADQTEAGPAALCTEIRRCCQLPLILLLDTEDAMERIAALTLGADVVLPASVLPLELLAQIRALVRRIHSSGKPEHALENAPKPTDASAFCQLPPITGSMESAPSLSREERHELGNLCLCPKSRTARCGETPLSLTPKEFDFLLILLHRKGAVQKEELLRLVWRQEQADFHAADDLVKRLRKKLRASCADISLETVRGYGYRLVWSA